MKFLGPRMGWHALSAWTSNQWYCCIWGCICL